MRSTGPTTNTRRSVHERDGGCVNCGSSKSLQIHHRRPRAIGGTRREDTNGQANLILLCAGCHAKVESQRQWAITRGLLVSQYQTPAEVSLRWHGAWVLLHDDGTIQNLASEPTLISGSEASTTCPCGKNAPQDGGAEGICECCSTCTADGARMTSRDSSVPMASPVASGGRTAAGSEGEAGSAATSPSYAELSARLLLGQSLINQRTSPEGLSAADAVAVLAALCGRWDAA